MNNRILYWSVFTILVLQISSAQVNVQSTISTMYDDNVNSNVQQWSSNVTTVSLLGGYLWEGASTTTELYYDGSFMYFNSLLERTHHTHTVAVDFSSVYGEEDHHLITAGASAGSSVNRDSYTLFDHSVISAFINNKYTVNDWMIHKTGYTIRSLSFAAVSDFSYIEHALFAHAAFAVTPTTTAIVQTDLGTKFYSTTPASSGSSMRKGVFSSLLPSVSQLTGMVKVGQRITDEVGVSVTERYQWNIQKQTRYFSSEYGFISDDEIFDDHYGYEGFHTNIALTILASESMTLKISGGIQEKIYSSLAAFDLAGNFTADQRIDTRSYVNVGLHTILEGSGVSVKGAVDLIRNASNDAFYDYSNSAVTVEFGIPL